VFTQASHSRGLHVTTSRRCVATARETTECIISMLHQSSRRACGTAALCRGADGPAICIRRSHEQAVTRQLTNRNRCLRRGAGSSRLAWQPASLAADDTPLRCKNMLPVDVESDRVALDHGGLLTLRYPVRRAGEEQACTLSVSPLFQTTTVSEAPPIRSNGSCDYQRHPAASFRYGLVALPSTKGTCITAGAGQH
jgi:hypothetical protein